MLIATTTQNTNDLEQVLSLQKRNLVGGLSAAERQDQGFVTVAHTLEMLEQMHSLAPSIIIKDGDNVVAYALTMLCECRTLVPALEPMFHNFDQISWKGKPLSEYEFYVMGQICVDKAYRGQGLFDQLYQQHKEIYSSRFDLLATEIATRNTRSRRAHERVGFKTVNIYTDELDEWAVVIWDWNSPQA